MNLSYKIHEMNFEIFFSSHSMSWTCCKKQNLVPIVNYLNINKKVSFFYIQFTGHCMCECFVSH